MNTIYFMRHGEVFNPKEILYGRLPNFPLSENGIQSVQSASDELNHKQVSVIYTSPMLRARQTASILNQKINVPIHISRLLIEVKIYCQGIPLTAYRQKVQETLYRQKNLLEGQESIDSIYQRMMKFVEMVRIKHPNQAVIAVTHGDPMLILKAVTTGKTFTWDYKKENYKSTGKWLELVVNNNIFYWR